MRTKEATLERPAGDTGDGLGILMPQKAAGTAGNSRVVIFWFLDY